MHTTYLEYFGQRAEQRAQTKALLLRASIEVFGEFGYAAATVGQIAERAGTSRPTFYTHFDGKAAVAVQLVHELGVHFDRVFTELFELVPLTRNGVREWVVDAIRLWDPMEPLPTIVDQATVLEPVVRQLRDAQMGASIRATAEFLKRHRTDLADDDALLHACRLISAFHVIRQTRLLDLSPLAAITVESLTDDWWKVLGSRMR
ncbi:hypothetical protein JCM18899A_54830 [Nocardioides sp. AN3]